MERALNINYIYTLRYNTRTKKWVISRKKRN